MIADGTVKLLMQWFIAYADSFSSEDPDIQFNLTLKKDHTLRVVENTIAIATALELPKSEQNIARVIALIHDVGRFEQYAHYKTFIDRDSVDHALLSIDILREVAVLEPLETHDRELILTAIEHHNQAVVPDSLTERERFFCRLLRDADKLDIMRMLIERYRTAAQDAKGAIELLLPQGEGISPEALADLMSGTIVKFSHVQKANDLKLLQMAWVFDMNFIPSLRIFKEHGYLEALRDALPKTEEVMRAYEFVKAEMEKRAGM